jgi:hypothetical protein
VAASHAADAAFDFGNHCFPNKEEERVKRLTLVTIPILRGFADDEARNIIGIEIRAFEF